MALNSLRTRGASLLHSPTQQLHQQDSPKEKPPSYAPTSNTEQSLNEKASHESGHNKDLEKTQSSSWSGNIHPFSGVDAVAHDRDAQRIVRTIPTWVHTLDEDDEDLLAPSQPLLSPAHVQLAHHNTTPSAIHRHNHLARGRLYDHQREWTPPLPRRTVMESGSRWRAFAVSSAYPATSAEGGEIVTEEWLVKNGADYSRPWLADEEDGDPEKGPASLFRSRMKRRAWYLRAQRTILRSPVVPMVIRLIVGIFSMLALAIAVSIRRLTTTMMADSTLNIKPRTTPSTDMAIVVDAVAIVYLSYITYDEYSSKPLGLRSAKAKMRLIFLDLFFIVFDSANLSLAFEAVQDNSKGNGPHQINDRQETLASVLLTALIAWLLTFSISVLRLVERVTGR